MDLSELLNMVRDQGRALDEFKNNHIARLDDLEKRFNRPQLGASDDTPGFKETSEQRKALELGIRALITGRQAEADKYFAEVNAETKAMSAGTDPDGGYVVTPTFSTDMTRIMLETAPVLDLFRTVELTSGDSFDEPVDKDSAAANWVGEGQARNDTETPQLGDFNCPVHEICAMPKTTQKLIDVARIDIVSWLQGKVAEKFANTEVDAFLNGNGVARPRGFLTYPTAATPDASRAWGTMEHVPSGAAGAFLAAANGPADCLIDLVSKVKPQYRAGAVWVMNRTTQAAVRKLKDQQGRFLLVDSLVAGQPPQLLGYPVIEGEQMPDIAANALAIAFGNFKKGYTIVRRLGVRFLVDPYTDKPNVRLYAYARVGGGVNNFEAIKYLKFSVS